MKSKDDPQYKGFPPDPPSLEAVKVKLWLGDGKTLDIEAPSNWLSAPVTVNSMGAWAVGETVVGTDGKPSFKELGRATAAASPRQMLLLVRKGKDNAAGFDMIALDERSNGFGPGKFLFMNAARVDVAGIVGQEKFVVKPGQHAVLAPKIAAGEHTFHAAFYHRKGDAPEPFFGSEWRFYDNARSLVFFYHDPATTHIRLHSITDYIP